MKIGKSENKSTPPTEYSNERPSGVEASVVEPPQVMTRETNSNKPKKKSKFKEKIYKYFVNSYK